MFQNLPLPAAQEVRDSSGVTLCIVMKNDQVSYSPERLMKVVLQKRAIVRSIYRYLGGTAWCIITPSLSYATMNITSTAHCVGRTFFGRGEP